MVALDQLPGVGHAIQDGLARHAQRGRDVGRRQGVGLREYDFYTVLFGVGRVIGVLANITWDRGLGYAIERPKSITTDMLEQAAGIR